MTPIGAPDHWKDLLDSLVPDILQLILAAWATMPALPGDAREDPISNELCRRLRANRNSCDLPFQIRTQLVELDPAAGEDQGRMDIVFLPMVNREDIYFCLECKRLNVVGQQAVRPYTSEYITFGMMRFIRGQYASQVSHGGMLAYVLNGQVDVARQNVAKMIQARHLELRMEPPGIMLQSSVLPTELNVRETAHTRGGTSEKFVIHHLFAAVTLLVPS